MASFTDIIPQFNPYVQQLPVEAMMMVGMEKQKRYDEGIQKIQSQIDKIGGLEILPDVDKAYLQSKLNELGNNLKTVAAGDFSNFQLVTSVGGMIGQIGQDPKIRAAVQSTAQDKAELARIQKDKESGKFNPANADRYYRRRQNWLYSSEPGQSLTASYMTPVDVWGKIKDVAASVGLDSTSVQQLFKTDANGNPVYKQDENGNMALDWNPIMVEKTLKGKDANKILGAIQTALGPAEYEQLAIDGEYLNRGKSVTALRDDIIRTSKPQLDFIDSKLLNIKAALVNEESKNDRDDAKIQSLSEQLQYFDKLKASVESSRDKNLSVVATDPDYVRGRLYTNNYLVDISKRLSSQDVDTKHTVSPMWTVTMDQNRFNRDIQRDKIADYHWSEEQKRKDREFEYSQKKDALEMFYKYGVKLPGLTLPSAGPGDFIKEPIETSAGEGVAKAIVEDAYSANVQTLNQTNYQLTLEYFKNINPKKPDESDSQYENRMKQAIYSYASANREVVDPTSGDVNTFTARFAAKQLETWKRDKNGVPVTLRGLVEQQDILSKDLSLQKGRIESIRKDAIQQARERGLTVPTQEEINQNIKPGQIVLGDGTSKNLSRADIIDFIDLMPSAFNVYGNTFTSREQEERARRAALRLKARFGDVTYGKLVDAVYTSGLEGGISAHPLIRNAASYLSTSNYRELAKIESKMYLDKGYIKQGMTAPVPKGDMKTEDYKNRISSVIGKYGANINEIPGFNEEDMQAALLGEGAAGIKVTSTPGPTAYSPSSHVLKITGKNGKTYGVQIDDDDYEFLMRMQAPGNVPMPKVLEQINHYKTSNLSGSSNSGGSRWFNDSDFTNLNMPGVTATGDLDEDAQNPNKLWFKIYLHDNAGNVEPIVYPTPFFKVNPADGKIDMQLDYLPSGINSTVIQQIRKKR
jgi:hypothetical protein